MRWVVVLLREDWGRLTQEQGRRWCRVIVQRRRRLL